MYEPAEAILIKPPVPDPLTRKHLWSSLEEESSALHKKGIDNM